MKVIGKLLDVEPGFTAKNKPKLQLVFSSGNTVTKIQCYDSEQNPINDVEKRLQPKIGKFITLPIGMLGNAPIFTFNANETIEDANLKPLKAAM